MRDDNIGAIRLADRRGPPTVAAALEIYPFRIYRDESELVPEAEGLVLLCVETAPPTNGSLKFRIVEAVNERSNAGMRARELLKRSRETDADPAVFALIAPMPHATRDGLMPKLRDSIAVRRVFSIAFPAVGSPGRASAEMK